MWTARWFTNPKPRPNLGRAGDLGAGEDSAGAFSALGERFGIRIFCQIFVFDGVPFFWAGVSLFLVSCFAGAGVFFFSGTSTGVGTGGPLDSTGVGFGMGGASVFAGEDFADTLAGAEAWASPFTGFAAGVLGAVVLASPLTGVLELLLTGVGLGGAAAGGACLEAGSTLAPFFSMRVGAPDVPGPLMRTPQVGHGPSAAAASLGTVSGFWQAGH